MTEVLPTRRSCGAMDEHRRLLTEDPSYVVARAQIENLARAYERGARTAERTGISNIPVVIHVVWQTQAQNISDDQIRSQIEVLNRDFRKQNADVGQVPAVWQSIVGDARIMFSLATTNPNGNSTSGITRTQTASAPFARNDNRMKSAATGGADPWPADRYLNLWVCQLVPDLLGSGQYPGGPPETDGVVITYTAFGTNGAAAAPFNRGRTTTHEVGHWLNLWHIWGEDGTGCTDGDEVADTPNQADENYGSPNFPTVSCSNGPNGDMFMNYMDYVDDASMFMFTAGQVARMQAALDGPRSSIGSQVEAGTATGKFFTTDGSGNISLLRDHTDWRSNWKDIVPGNFGGSSYTDLLFYDANDGDAKFFTTDGSGNITLLRAYTAWSHGWDQIVPGNFGGSSYTDLLFYDANDGDAKFFTTDGSGNIALLRAHTNWRTNWKDIVPGNFGGTSYTDLLFYQP